MGPRNDVNIGVHQFERMANQLKEAGTPADTLLDVLHLVVCFEVTLFNFSVLVSSKSR